MKIEITEKPRMTVDLFMEKWDSNMEEVDKDMLADLNSLLGEQQEEKVEYPCLMVSDGGLVILVQEKSKYDNLKGTVIQCEHTGYDVGEYREVWDATQFKPFHGTITITQE